MRKLLYVSALIAVAILAITSGGMMLRNPSASTSGTQGIGAYASGGSNRSPAGDLACGPNAYISATHRDSADVPGGPQTPDEAMRTITIDLPKLDPSRLERSASDGVNFAQYVLREDNANVAKFEVRRIGDSWHISSYSICGELEPKLR